MEDASPVDRCLGILSEANADAQSQILSGMVLIALYVISKESLTHSSVRAHVQWVSNGTESNV